MTNQYTPLDKIRPDQPAPTPRTEELSTMGKMELALYSEQHDALCAILGTRRISIVEAVRMVGEQLSAKTAEAERLRETLTDQIQWVAAFAMWLGQHEVVMSSDRMKRALAATRKEEHDAHR